MDESLKSYRKELLWKKTIQYSLVIGVMLPLMVALFTPFPISLFVLIITPLYYFWLYKYFKENARKIRVLKMAIYWRQMELNLRTPDPENPIFQDIINILGDEKNN
jgi:hypothetical protein